MIVFRQNEPSAAQREIFIQMVSDADGFTPATGLTVAVQIVKAGQTAYANIAGTVTEVGHGTYKVSLAAADLNTRGAAMLKASAAGALNAYAAILVGRLLDEVHRAKAALVNASRYNRTTGALAVKDDDGTTDLLTLTPTQSGDYTIITPG